MQKEGKKTHPLFILHLAAIPAGRKVAQNVGSLKFSHMHYLGGDYNRPISGREIYFFKHFSNGKNSGMTK